MFVRMWMADDVVTTSPGTPIMEARDLMKRRNIRRLPVLDGKARLVGIVTWSDILEAGPSDATSLSIWELNYLLARTTVAEVMTKADDLITVGPDDTIEHAAQLMRKHKVGGLPVLENKKLVGVITESDVFDVFLELMGIEKGGTRLTLEIEDRPGALAEALDVIKEREVNVMSIVTCEECRAALENPNHAVVVLRVAAYDWRSIVKDLKDKGKGKIRVLDARA